MKPSVRRYLVAVLVAILLLLDVLSSGHRFAALDWPAEGLPTTPGSAEETAGAYLTAMAAQDANTVIALLRRPQLAPKDLKGRLSFGFGITGPLTRWMLVSREGRDPVVAVDLVGSGSGGDGDSMMAWIAPPSPSTRPLVADFAGSPPSAGSRWLP